VTRAPNPVAARSGQRQPDPPGLRFRPARGEDLRACWEIWRDGLNGYMVPLNLPPIPPDVGSVARLHEHLRSTDPERFVVAARRGEDGAERLVGFASAARRDDVWFLSMLFVRPQEQGSGVGRALLARVLPRDDAILATATDTVQPISNALYASYGIVPRMPLFSLVGRPERDAAFEPLPAGVAATPFEAVATGDGEAQLATTVDAIDRDALGFSHRQDHAFVRLEGRRGFLYRGPDGAVLGYGCASEVGRVGPVAVRDERLLPAVLGHLLGAIQPRGASAVWVAGAADRAMVPLLRAGFRLDGFPVLLCWTRPFADFSRYLPISPGLL
jgi:GNAT superfamily N-acetyltransferase